MDELHNNHKPGYIPQIELPKTNVITEVRHHRAIYHKATGPGFFGVIILCFFMSFINIKCNGYLVDSYTGMQIVRGVKSNTKSDGSETGIIACKKSAYHALQSRENNSVIAEEDEVETIIKNKEAEFDIPENLDETSKNPKRTRMFAIIGLFCACAGAVFSLLKKNWGAWSQTLLGALGFISILLMQFYIKVTVPTVTKPGSPLYAEYQAPVVTTELAFGYWLAFFLFLAVTVVGYFKVRYLRKNAGTLS